MEQKKISAIQQEWERRISDSGSRMTESRRAILQVIAASDHPLTAVDIFDRARSFAPGLGLVTVYRTIEKLEHLGLIDRIHGQGQCQAVFRSSDSHQHLLSCTSCGISVYFDGLATEQKFQEIGRTNGFAISGHWLQLYGLCSHCREDQEDIVEK